MQKPSTKITIFSFNYKPPKIKIKIKTKININNKTKIKTNSKTKTNSKIKTKINNEINSKINNDSICSYKDTIEHYNINSIYKYFESFIYNRTIDIKYINSIEIFTKIFKKILCKEKKHILKYYNKYNICDKKLYLNNLIDIFNNIIYIKNENIINKSIKLLKVYYSIYMIDFINNINY
jgi:hypothetical protein